MLIPHILYTYCNSLDECIRQSTKITKGVVLTRSRRERVKEERSGQIDPVNSFPKVLDKVHLTRGPVLTVLGVKGYTYSMYDYDTMYCT